MPLCPSERILTIFDVWGFFENLSRKFIFVSNLTRTTGTLHEDSSTFMISHWNLLRTRNVWDKISRANQNTHFMFNNIFRKPCPLRDNVQKYGTAGHATDGNIKERMRFKCSITKDSAHTMCNTYCLSMVTRTRLNITFYIYCLYCSDLYLEGALVKQDQDTLFSLKLFVVFVLPCR